MIVLRQLPASDLARLGEIDRSERVTTGYKVRDGRLQAEPVDWDVPPWRGEGDGPHSVAGQIAGCAPLVAAGGALLGALEGERLAGVALLRHRLRGTTAQLAFLHVSRAYRRQGIATRLLEEVCRLARQSGAEALYVSATPSESAVGFYLSHGFGLASEPDAELLALEPEDIHLLKRL